MLRANQITQPKTALLSATNIAGDGRGGAMALVAGQPLLAHQIDALHAVGVSRFLLEVDNVPGELLALADRYRGMGHNVDFVRSASDLKEKLGMTEPLIVQAEALYLAPDLLHDLLAEDAPYLLTLDGRDENSTFERMDLNTRWAGWAILDAPTIASLEPLPDGWSISSSLLRQAMQDRVTMVSLPQQNIQQGFVRLMTSASDADLLSKQILTGRARRFGGLIESKVFAPVAARIAPLIWKSRLGSNAVDGAMVAFAGGSLALAATGWTISFLVLAIGAIFINRLRAILRDADQERGVSRWVQPISWLLLGAAAIVAGYDDFSYSSDGAYAATIMIGLLLLSQQLNLPVWAQNMLKSPALLAIAALTGTFAMGFAQSAQWISLVQLAALIVAKWAHSFGAKKANTALKRH